MYICGKSEKYKPGCSGHKLERGKKRKLIQALQPRPNSRKDNNRNTICVWTVGDHTICVISRKLSPLNVITLYVSIPCKWSEMLQINKTQKSTKSCSSNGIWGNIHPRSI